MALHDKTVESTPERVNVLNDHCADDGGYLAAYFDFAVMINVREIEIITSP